MRTPTGPAVLTPQFRTALLRTLKNDFPSCSSKIEAGQRGGVVFQLFDGEGNARTMPVSIYRHLSDTLTRSKLVEEIKIAGTTEAGFPDEIISS